MCRAEETMSDYTVLSESFTNRTELTSDLTSCNCRGRQHFYSFYNRPNHQETKRLSRDSELNQFNKDVTDFYNLETCNYNNSNMTWKQHKKGWLQLLIILIPWKMTSVSLKPEIQHSETHLGWQRPSDADHDFFLLMIHCYKEGCLINL